MPPANWNHEEVDGDQLGAPTPFAVTLATAMANYRGREGHEIAKLRASIPGIIEDQWKEWRPKVVEWAAAGKDLCWFRPRFRTRSSVDGRSQHFQAPEKPDSLPPPWRSPHCASSDAVGSSWG